jgi:hypothetical protein
MTTADYSRELRESAQDGKWKTARKVNPADFPQVTHRLRYQARQLGLEIHIDTNKQENTVSFIAHESREEKGR